MSGQEDRDAIREAAGRLFDEKTRAAGWTDADLGSYPGWSIRQAVAAIAAGGEAAGMRQVIGMYSFAPPRLDPATGQVADPLLDMCMAAIQEARHARFDGNTGWTWDEESQRWTARRGTALVTAVFPRDAMPPVRADLLAVQLTGEPHYAGNARIMDNPGEASLPWKRPVLAEIPEPFWSGDWCRGVRYKTVLGMLCSHSGPESRVCVQPRRENQAEGMEADCVPFDPDRVRLIVLDGKLSDYS